MNSHPQELDKFNSLSQHWWDPNGPLKSLHQINPLRLDFIKKYISLKNKKMLDVGCGGGILTESLSQYGQTTGLDLAADCIAVAQQHAIENELKDPPTYIMTSAEHYAQQVPSTFDMITCMEMLEHVPSPQSILTAISTLLKPGGHFFCSTLNRNLSSYLQAIIGAEYILKLLPQGTHDYAAFIRPSELSAMAANVGLQLKALAGIHYNLFTQTFSLSTNINVNYLGYFIKK